MAHFGERGSRVGSVVRGWAVGWIWDTGSICTPPSDSLRFKFLNFLPLVAVNPDKTQ